MIELLTQVITQAAPHALGFMSPAGLAYTAVTGVSALVAHFSASAFVAATPTPKAETTWGKIYKLIEVLALAISKAKEK